MSIQQPFQFLRTMLGLLLAAGQSTLSANAGDSPLDLRGVAVVPHIQSEEMRYRREPDRSLGAWVLLFLVNRGSSPLSLSPKTPVRLRDKHQTNF
jgi:hypothetical protein